ncbi:MAG: CsbD family protein [Proteobacteria bacterium]|nr:CsbD family protein [Pseudomonadota bacterium]MBW3617355.1 CsbD family protein [Pseudomonadota bacterium]
MDKNRVEGSGDQAKGNLKEGLGHLTGDEKLKNEGRGDQAGGKIKNAIGGAVDAVKDAAGDAKQAVDRKTDGNRST